MFLHILFLALLFSNAPFMQTSQFKYWENMYFIWFNNFALVLLLFLLAIFLYANKLRRHAFFFLERTNFKVFSHGLPQLKTHEKVIQLENIKRTPWCVVTARISSIKLQKMLVKMTTPEDQYFWAENYKKHHNKSFRKNITVKMWTFDLFFQIPVILALPAWP